jgi:hypothetical protein
MIAAMDIARKKQLIKIVTDGLLIALVLLLTGRQGG